MKRRMHKGFTLVELLIVVAILGTLASAMMIATQNATPNAKAKQIVTDLKSIASAVAVYFADDDTPTAEEFETNKSKYLFGTKLENYKVAADTTAGKTDQWIATYDVELDSEVQAQLTAIADATSVTVDATSKKASMRVR